MFIAITTISLAVNMQLQITVLYILIQMPPDIQWLFNQSNHPPPIKILEIAATQLFFIVFFVD